MRSGKLFKLVTPTDFYKMEFTKQWGQQLKPGTIFMVVTTKPDQRIANYHDIHIPWQVIVEDKIGLIEINRVTMEDITPFEKQEE